MARNLGQKVRERARNLCEYCRMPQEFERAPFQLEHIIAINHPYAVAARQALIEEGLFPRQ